MFDVTASMKNVADAVRSRATELMQAIRDVSANSAFGVATFGDYPGYGGTTPWELYQDLTLDISLAASALERVTAWQDGGDFPEAYSRGLYETLGLSWRSEARRFVVLFGDATPHDPDFFGKDHGVDPGRDGVRGTADDLRFADVVAQLAAQGIRVIALYDATTGASNKSLGETKRAFEFVGERTGGLAKPLLQAAEVVEAVKAGVRASYRPIPSLHAPDEFSSWVGIGSPQPLDDVGQRFRFEVVLRPPEGTPSSVQAFPLIAVFGDAGGEIGRSLVVVRLGWLGLPWRRILLPFYLLLLLLLLFRTLRRMGRTPVPVRLLFNRQGWAILGRLVLLALLLVTPYLIWEYSPGTIAGTAGEPSPLPGASTSAPLPAGS